jgi:hypothetical protein
MKRGCAEHAQAKAWLDAALGEPREWIFADRVLFELHRLPRHPRVMAKPLSGEGGGGADRVVSRGNGVSALRLR